MAADLGARLTDDRMRAMSLRLDEVYRSAYKKALAREHEALLRFEKLTDEALAGMTDEAIRLKRQAFENEIRRNKELANNIAEEIMRAGTTATNIIQGEMSQIYKLNYDFSTYSIQRQAGINLSFTQYDRNQITALVQAGQSPFTKIAYKNLGQDKKIVQRLQNNLLQATILGESQAKIIKRIQGVTGQSLRQAKRVAQTERTRVQSQGRQLGIDEANEMGVETFREWSARMVNTRDAHIDLNGQITEHDEPFDSILGDIWYPGDPDAEAENVINCFCLIKPKVNSVSPALARHREKFDRSMAFNEYAKDIERNIEKYDIMYDKAKEGILHGGVYTSAMSKTEAQLNKSIKSYEKQIDIHRMKINNPRNYDKEWNNRSSLEKAGAFNYWNKEIINYQEQSEIVRRVKWERGFK